MCPDATTESLNMVYLSRLNLHLGQAVFPDSQVRCYSVLAVVKQGDPGSDKHLFSYNFSCYSHSISVHGFADVKVIVFEVWADNILEVGLGASLEFLDRVLTGAVLLELLDNLLHVR